MPPSKSFALKVIRPSVVASSMVMAAAFAEFGAIRAIAEIARHVDIKWWIFTIFLDSCPWALAVLTFAANVRTASVK